MHVGEERAERGKGSEGGVLGAIIQANEFSTSSEWSQGSRLID